MEHFAFNYISHQRVQAIIQCVRAHVSCTRWLSVEVIKMRTKILCLMFNLNFSTAWLPILAVHLSAMVSNFSAEASAHSIRIRLCKTHDFHSCKKIKYLKRPRDVNGEHEITSMCVSRSDIVGCERVDESVSRAQHVIKQKKCKIKKEEKSDMHAIFFSLLCGIRGNLFGNLKWLNKSEAFTV